MSEFIECPNCKSDAAAKVATEKWHTDWECHACGFRFAIGTGGPHRPKSTETVRVVIDLPSDVFRFWNEMYAGMAKEEIEGELIRQVRNVEADNADPTYLPPDDLPPTF